MTFLASDITYEFTANNELLEQYFAIREECLRKEWGLVDYSGARDKNDLDGHILVAIKDNVCIGGARWIPAPLTDRKLLHIESENFKLTDFFPGLKQYNYCEFGRLAVASNERQQGKVARDLLSCLLVKARECFMDFLIFEIDKLKDSRFRQIFADIGIDIERQDVDMSFLTCYHPAELALYIAKL